MDSNKHISRDYSGTGTPPGKGTPAPKKPPVNPTPIAGTEPLIRKWLKKITRLDK